MSSGGEVRNKSSGNKAGRGLTFSFSAGGWLQMYMFGVASCLQDSGLLDESTKFVGASAGSLAACCLAGDLNMDDVQSFTLDCSDHLRSKWYHSFFMKEYVDVAIDKFASDIMARDEQSGTTEVRDRLSETLEIYCTVLPKFQQKVFSEFTCKEDIKEALFASVCLAPMVGFPFRLRSTGELVVDGGISAFQPKAGKPRVITISPFYFANADIRPSQFIPVWWSVRPPKRQQLAALFDLGYNDAMDFLVRKQMVSLDEDSESVSGGHHMKRRPEPRAPRRGNYPVLLDLVVLFFSYVIMRPLAIIIVYLEMIVMTIFYFLRLLISSNDRGAAVIAWLDSVYNLWNPMVFVDLVLGSAAHHGDDSRLAGRSAMYRFLAPIAFGKQVEDNLPPKKKRFNVSMAVGAPSMMQKKFDEFRNLGWDHSSTLFKDRDGRVVSTGSGSDGTKSSSSASSVSQHVVSTPTTSPLLSAASSHPAGAAAAKSLAGRFRRKGASTKVVLPSAAAAKAPSNTNKQQEEEDDDDDDDDQAVSSGAESDASLSGASGTSDLDYDGNCSETASQ